MNNYGYINKGCFTWPENCFGYSIFRWSNNDEQQTFNNPFLLSRKTLTCLNIELSTPKRKRVKMFMALHQIPVNRAGAKLGQIYTYVLFFPLGKLLSLQSPVQFNHSQLFGWSLHIKANSTRQLLASPASCLKHEKKIKITVISDQGYAGKASPAATPAAGCFCWLRTRCLGSGAGAQLWKIPSVSICCISTRGSPSLAVAAMAEDCQYGPAQPPKTSCRLPSSFPCSQASVETPPQWQARPPRLTVLY